MTACTTTASSGMEIENDTPEMNELRKIIVETMFVTGIISVHLVKKWKL